MKLFIILISLFISNCSFSQENEDTLKVYSQNLNVLPPFPKNYFISVRGTLTITKEEVYFEVDKNKHRRYEFNLPFKNIDKTEGWGAFIIPNPWFLPIMIKIKTKDGKKILLTTFKRKKILSLLNNKSS